MADTLLLSDHGRLLLAVAEDADRTVADLAASAGLSESDASAMLDELVDAGCLLAGEGSWPANSESPA